MLIKMREMMRRKDDQRGFTLVELIVVMAILAILVAIAVPKFGNVLKDSRVKAHKANVEVLTRAGELYYAEKGSEMTDDYVEFTDATGDIAKYVRDWPENPVDKSEGYTITIEKNGDVTVTPAADEYDN